MAKFAGTYCRNLAICSFIWFFEIWWTWTFFSIKKICCISWNQIFQLNKMKICNEKKKTLPCTLSNPFHKLVKAKFLHTRTRNCQEPNPAIRTWNLSRTWLWVVKLLYLKSFEVFKLISIWILVMIHHLLH